MNNVLPAISVIMPVHNAGQYLEEAVQSILQQNDVAFELVIINDNSTDYAIEQLAKDTRIKVIESPRRGLVAALNHGIKHAKHSFIARMDGDDIAHPSRLSIQLKHLLDNPDVDIVGAAVQLFSSTGEVGEGYKLYESWINQQRSSTQIAENFFVESCIPHPTAMMRSSLFSELGGYHDVAWPEDYDLWCRAYLAGKQFAKPAGPALLEWRDHAMRASRVQQRYDIQQFLECKAHYLSRYLKQQQKTECVIWGTGPTGLKLHDHLEKNGIRVTAFIDVNPKLIGKQKRGKTVNIINVNPKLEELQLDNKICIIAVAARGAREEISTALTRMSLAPLRDYILAT